jgi:hypothetical protein
MYHKACEHFCRRVKSEAGGCQKMKAGVRWRPFGHEKNRRLACSSLLASFQAACEALRERRFRCESGRRDSNPRQPAWKAGGCALAARLIYIGLTAGFIRFTCIVSVPGKRCRARFFRLSAKHVACFCLRFWQKVLRASRDRRSRCCTNYTLSHHHCQ